MDLRCSFDDRESLAGIIKGASYSAQLSEFIDSGLSTMTSIPLDQKTSREKLLKLLATKAYRNGHFILSSGKESNHYVNCKPVSLSGDGLALLSYELLAHIEERSLAVAGLTLGADPLVSGVAMAAAQKDRSLDALIVRKEAKSHGTGDWLEGPLPPSGGLVTVLEDVVTTGGSCLMAVDKLREAGYEVGRVITIVDRQEGGETLIKEAGLELVSLFLLDEVATCAKNLEK